MPETPLLDELEKGPHPDFMKEVRERPILFKPEMVRAILDGRKTQTRRVLRPQPQKEAVNIENASEAHESPYFWEVFDKHDNGLELLKCPLWKGDHLWVRETFGIYEPARPEIRHTLPLFEYYTSDVPDNATEDDIIEAWVLDRLKMQDNYELIYRATNTIEHPIYWRPSIFMPRWASRILLEVTEVRVQRVQDISEEDAKAEGAWEVEGDNEWGGADEYFYFRNDQGKSIDGKMYGSPENAFSVLWDSINKKRGFPWDANPWVWAYTFRRLEP